MPPGIVLSFLLSGFLFTSERMLVRSIFLLPGFVEFPGNANWEVIEDSFPSFVSMLFLFVKLTRFQSVFRCWLAIMYRGGIVFRACYNLRLG